MAVLRGRVHVRAVESRCGGAPNTDSRIKFARNALAHAPGLDVPNAPDIGMNKGPLSEWKILELEDAFLLPTLAAPGLRTQGAHCARLPRPGL